MPPKDQSTTRQAVISAAKELAENSAGEFESLGTRQLLMVLSWATNGVDRPLEHVDVTH